MMAFDPSMNNVEGIRRSQRRAIRKFEYKHALLAVGDEQLLPGVLPQAQAVAGELGAHPHVLRVLPPERTFLSSLMQESHSIHSTRSGERCLAAVGELREWCDGVLSETVSAQCLHVRIGNFIIETVASAAQLDRSLVMLTPATEHVGATATAVARATLRPVLVVRPSRQRGAVLVGTDLEEDDSVLEQALDFGARLRSPVVALHNVNCLSTAVPVPEAGLAGLAPAPAVGAAPSVRLDRVSERLAPSLTILTNELNAVDAIIERARYQHARAIVVGTRSRSWFERLIEPSVAAAVVDRAECSVLILPCSQLRPR